MQTPEQTHLMTEIMINEMAEFPNDIGVYEPVPRKGCFYDCMLLKQGNTKNYNGYRNEFSDKCIEHEGKERNFIINRFKFSEDERFDYLEQQQYRKKRAEYRKNAVICKQIAIIAGIYD